tara:strand:- start:11 stop:226 length:216 start_codon:yes stop_codon:yes gene_type:complete
MVIWAHFICCNFTSKLANNPKRKIKAKIGTVVPNHWYVSVSLSHLDDGLIHRNSKYQSLAPENEILDLNPS